MLIVHSFHSIYCRSWCYKINKLLRKVSEEECWSIKQELWYILTKQTKFISAIHRKRRHEKRKTPFSVVDKNNEKTVQFVKNAVFVSDKHIPVTTSNCAKHKCVVFNAFEFSYEYILIIFIFCTKWGKNYKFTCNLFATNTWKWVQIKTFYVGNYIKTLIHAFKPVKIMQ